jgi:chromosome segregation ATPase
VLVEMLKGQIPDLQAHVETLRGQLAGAEERDAQHAADLAAERAKREKAIAAFASLVERLDALAAARAKPWWRRLVG